MKKTMLAAVAVLALLLGATPSAHATYDGVPSTGSFTIATNSALSAATATGSFTVLDTTSLQGVYVNLGAYQLKAGRDFQVGATTNASAANLAAAINANDDIPVLASAVGTNVVSLTADAPGSLYNSVGLKTSNSLEISTSAATLARGQDNAVVTVNSTQLIQGRDWFVADVASNTAISLAYAVSINPVLRTQVTAQPIDTQVYLRAIVSPVAYKLAESAGTAITLSGPAMTGGSAGLLVSGFCYLGVVNALPTANYPAGCLLYLSSDPTKLYISTQAVTGAATNAANSWLAK